MMPGIFPQGPPPNAAATVAVFQDASSKRRLLPLRTRFFLRPPSAVGHDGHLLAAGERHREANDHPGGILVRRRPILRAHRHEIGAGLQQRSDGEDRRPRPGLDGADPAAVDERLAGVVRRHPQLGRLDGRRQLEPAAEEPRFGRGIFGRPALGVPNPARQCFGVPGRRRRGRLLAEFRDALFERVQLFPLGRQVRRRPVPRQPLGQFPRPADFLDGPRQQRLPHRLIEPVAFQRPGRFLGRQRPRLRRPRFALGDGQVPRPGRRPADRDEAQHCNRSQEPHSGLHRIRLPNRAAGSGTSDFTSSPG